MSQLSLLYKHKWHVKYLISQMLLNTINKF